MPVPAGVAAISPFSGTVNLRSKQGMRNAEK